MSSNGFERAQHSNWLVGLTHRRVLSCASSFTAESALINLNSGSAESLPIGGAARCTPHTTQTTEALLARVACREGPRSIWSLLADGDERPTTTLHGEIGLMFNAINERINEDITNDRPLTDRRKVKWRGSRAQERGTVTFSAQCATYY